MITIYSDEQARARAGHASATPPPRIRYLGPSGRWVPTDGPYIARFMAEAIPAGAPAPASHDDSHHRSPGPS